MWLNWNPANSCAHLDRYQNNMHVPYLKRWFDISMFEYQTMELRVSSFPLRTVHSVCVIHIYLPSFQTVRFLHWYHCYRLYLCLSMPLSLLPKWKWLFSNIYYSIKVFISHSVALKRFVSTVRHKSTYVAYVTSQCITKSDRERIQWV